MDNERFIWEQKQVPTQEEEDRDYESQSSSYGNTNHQTIGTTPTDDDVYGRFISQYSTLPPPSSMMMITPQLQNHQPIAPPDHHRQQVLKQL
uniref:Uncharacterized protein n=1 Tax=Helianthus annuus TaxID=4232 RepID=A0A251T9Y8_HELAN